jgi:prepilin-type N-terminal cleavage/methylation domain-containing protein
MKRGSEKGFTIVEVLIAIIMLTIGVLALASSSGSTTRMMNFGRMKTDATAIAQSVLDSLRYVSAATSPKCTDLVSGSLLIPPKLGFTTSWRVTPSGVDLRIIVVTVAYRVGPQSKTETVTSSFFCR